MFPSELISVTISCETDAVCVHNTFLIISVASDAAINKLHFPKILIPVFGSSRHFYSYATVPQEYTTSSMQLRTALAMHVSYGM